VVHADHGNPFRSARGDGGGSTQEQPRRVIARVASMALGSIARLARRYPGRGRSAISWWACRRVLDSDQRRAARPGDIGANATTTVERSSYSGLAFRSSNSGVKFARRPFGGGPCCPERSPAMRARTIASRRCRRCESSTIGSSPVAPCSASSSRSLGGRAAHLACAAGLGRDHDRPAPRGTAAGNAAPKP